MDYIIDIEEILEKNEEEISNLFLKEIKGIKISDLKVKDLVFCSNNTPIRTGNGVYIFKYKDTAIYVGNCVARNFVERIPAHFDIRHNGWFNSMLRSILKNNNKEASDENLEKEALYAFNNFELILINFPKYNKEAMNKLEVYLRIVLDPINGFKHKKLEYANTIVKDYILQNRSLN